jgi:hypothetical protein
VVVVPIFAIMIVVVLLFAMLAARKESLLAPMSGTGFA